MYQRVLVVMRTGACMAGLMALALPSASTSIELSEGDLVVTDAGAFIGGTGKVVRVEPVSGAQTIISVGGFLEVPQGVAIERSGHIVVADGGGAIGGISSEIIRIDPRDGAQTIVSAGGFFEAPTGLVIDPQTNDLIVGDAGGLFGGTSRIIRVDPVNGDQEVISSGGWLSDPVLTVDDDGTVLVANLENVLRVDLETGAQTIISSGGFFVNVSFVVIESEESILVIDSEAFGGDGGVIRVDIGTGGQTPLFSGGFISNPFGGALNQYGSLVLTSADSVDPTGGTTGITEILLDTGSQRLVTSMGLLELPLQVTIVPEPERDLLVVAACVLLVLFKRSTRERRPGTGPFGPTCQNT